MRSLRQLFTAPADGRGRVDATAGRVLSAPGAQQGAGPSSSPQAAPQNTTSGHRIVADQRGRTPSPSRRGSGSGDGDQPCDSLLDHPPNASDARLSSLPEKQDGKGKEKEADISIDSVKEDETRWNDNTPSLMHQDPDLTSNVTKSWNEATADGEIAGGEAVGARAEGIQTAAAVKDIKAAKDLEKKDGHHAPRRNSLTASPRPAYLTT